MNKQKQAFTLVELIVVITILAILWTIAFISLQWYSKDARDSIRISDISNIKTSLELFHLNSGKYPLPDDKQIVDYWTEILWYQWDFWTTVISSLSRSMSEVPTDPLSDKKYVFSVANNKNEFELLSLLEWDSLALNNLSQTNAASLVVTPKIDGTYNRVFIKTANYIVPVPSIINTEVWAATMTLDSSNISSQVINWGENIPEQWNVISNTWALTWLVLSVYTWSIDINTSNSEKEIVIEKIKNTYTGSVLASSDIYNYILNTSWTEWLVKLANSIVLNDDTTEVVVSIPLITDECAGSESIWTECWWWTYAWVSLIATNWWCTDSATPVCDWSTDTLIKMYWTFPLVTGITSATDWEWNTASLVAGWWDTAAANYCNDMVLNWFSDWYLPAKRWVTLSL